jgi:hypothetical protein
MAVLFSHKREIRHIKNNILGFIMIYLRVCCLTTYVKNLSSHSTRHKWGPPTAEQQGHIQLRVVCGLEMTQCVITFEKEYRVNSIGFFFLPAHKSGSQAVCQNHMLQGNV